MATRMTNRAFLLGAATSLIASRVMGLTDRIGVRGSLRLKPPLLEAPQTLEIDVRGGNYKLGTGDYVIRFPSEPVTGAVRINGQMLARNIVIIGGEINLPINYNPQTMRPRP